VALLSPVAIASLSLTATACEVSSEVQMLSPFWTFVSPLMLTHTSPPWAHAAPEKAIIAPIIAPTVINTKMRFIR
jgi:hypothetical protein